MTDQLQLRTRIADAITAHRPRRMLDDLKHEICQQGCFYDVGDWYVHLVDALLALPGIAIVDAEDLWDAQQCVQDWRDSDNCDDTPAYRKRLSELAKRLRAAANGAASVKAEEQTP